MPLPGRWLTSLLLRFNGKMLLIDCGEGTQIPLKMAGWGFKAIDAIFFTHFHADHVAGLPGLLLTIGNSGKDTPLDLIGPPGILNVVRSLLVICSRLPFEIRVIELPGEAYPNAPAPGATYANSSTPDTTPANSSTPGATSADSSTPGATPANNSTPGATNANSSMPGATPADAPVQMAPASPPPASAPTPDPAPLPASPPSLPSPASEPASPSPESAPAPAPDPAPLPPSPPPELRPLCDIELFDGLYFQYALCDHNIACYAYSFRIRRQGVFFPERAQELDIPLKLWKRLQTGESVTLPDGRTIWPDMVLGPERKGIKLSYCTDSRPTSALRRLFTNSDLLICEGMYGDDAERDNARVKKHMVFSEAAKLAAESGSSELWLTHFSPSMPNPSEYIGAARRVFANAYTARDLQMKTLKYQD